MATWPVTLPQAPRISGISEEIADGTVRTEMDAGAAKVRRRFTAVPHIWRGVSFIMTTAQVETFETFYKTTLLNGSLEFEWTNPRTEATDNWRFLSAPKYVPAGNGKFIVTMDLEKMP